MAAAKKKLKFKPNEFVVYPAHGVGRVVDVEEQESAGTSLELYVIDFEKEKMTLKVPGSSRRFPALRPRQPGQLHAPDKQQIRLV